MIKSRMTRLAVPTVESLHFVREAERNAQQSAQQSSPFTFRPQKGTQFFGRRRGFADSRLNNEWRNQQLDEARLTSITADALLANPDYAAAVWTNEGKWAVNAAGTAAPAEYHRAVPELLPADTNRARALQHTARIAITAGTEAAPFVQPLETQLDAVRAAEMHRLTCRSMGSVAASTIRPTLEFEPQIPQREALIVGPLPLVPFDSMNGKLFDSKPTITAEEPALPSSLSTAPFPLESEPFTPPRVGELLRDILMPEQP